MATSAYGGGFDAVWHHYAVEAETGAQVIGHGLRYGEEAVGTAYEVGSSYAGGMEREKERIAPWSAYKSERHDVVGMNRVGMCRGYGAAHGKQP